MLSDADYHEIVLMDYFVWYHRTYHIIKCHKVTSSFCECGVRMRHNEFLTKRIAGCSCMYLCASTNDAVRSDYDVCVAM